MKHSISNLKIESVQKNSADKNKRNMNVHGIPSCPNRRNAW